mgnify:CR=1 FL=1
MNEQNVKNRVIGVDISIEETSYAIVDVRGNIIARDGFSTQEYPDVTDYVSVLSERVVKLAEESGGYENIRSMGISAPSGNFRTGCIENAPNLHWKGVVPMAAMLRDRLGIAVALGNDAHLAALGEHTFGSAHGMNNFIVITLGHGIGSCIFSNGEVHLGADGFAGEVGHTTLVYNGRTCGCGKKGHLEQYASATGVVRKAKEMLSGTDIPSTLRDLPNVESKDVFDAAKVGDELALAIVDFVGDTLGAAMAVISSVVDPEVFVFGGGVSKAGAILIDTVKKHFAEYAFHVSEKAEFELAKLGNDEGMYGAVKMILPELPE